MLWAAALGIAVFTLALLRVERRMNPYFAPLAALALLTALLLADDLFMFHERVLPLVADWLQETSPAYGAAVVAIAWRWRHLLRDTRTRDLGFYSVFWLGFSAFTDLFGGVPRAVHFFVEDGAKFLGIVAWSVLIAHLAARAVRYASLIPTSQVARDEQGSVEMAGA